MSIRVACYARVSTEDAQQENSLQNQVSLFRARVADTPGWQYAGVYADQGLSGTTEERPGFQRLLRDCMRGRIDLVLVKSISRFARNTLVTIQTVRALQAKGVTLIFEKEQIDTSKPYSEMLLTVLAAFAQEESRSISQRTKQGLRMRAQQGITRWSPLYGYRAGFVPQENEAATVRLIFQLYESGLTVQQVGQRLFARQIPSPGGQARWSNATLRALLGNEKYAGQFLTNKYYTVSYITHQCRRNRGAVEQILLENHHPALIPAELFARVQRIRQLRQHRDGLTSQYPFADSLRCPACGAPLRRVRQAWRCVCGGFAVPDALLRAAVLRAMQEQDATLQSVEYLQVDTLIERVDFAPRAGELAALIRWRTGGASVLPLPLPWA